MWHASSVTVRAATAAARTAVRRSTPTRTVGLALPRSSLRSVQARSITLVMPSRLHPHKNEAMNGAAVVIARNTKTRLLTLGVIKKMIAQGRFDEVEEMLASEPLNIITEAADVNAMSVYKKDAKGDVYVAEHGYVHLLRELMPADCDPLVILQRVPEINLVHCHSESAAQALARELKNTVVTGVSKWLEIDYDGIAGNTSLNLVDVDDRGQVIARVDPSEYVITGVHSARQVDTLQQSNFTRQILQAPDGNGAKAATSSEATTDSE